MRQLTEAIKQGYRSVVMILVQGVGAQRFRPNWETDPDFSDAFFGALDAEVEAYARVLRFRGKRINLAENLATLQGRRDWEHV